MRLYWLSCLKQALEDRFGPAKDSCPNSENSSVVCKARVHTELPSSSNSRVSVCIDPGNPSHDESFVPIPLILLSGESGGDAHVEESDSRSSPGRPATTVNQDTPPLNGKAKVEAYLEYVKQIESAFTSLGCARERQEYLDGYLETTWPYAREEFSWLYAMLYHRNPALIPQDRQSRHLHDNERKAMEYGATDVKNGRSYRDPSELCFGIHARQDMLFSNWQWPKDNTTTSGFPIAIGPINEEIEFVVQPPQGGTNWPKGKPSGRSPSDPDLRISYCWPWTAPWKTEWRKSASDTWQKLRHAKISDIKHGCNVFRRDHPLCPLLMILTFPLWGLFYVMFWLARWAWRHIAGYGPVYDWEAVSETLANLEAGEGGAERLKPSRIRRAYRRLRYTGYQYSVDEEARRVLVRESRRSWWEVALMWK